jgi:hypothetical protein
MSLFYNYGLLDDVTRKARPSRDVQTTINGAVDILHVPTFGSLLPW